MRAVGEIISEKMRVLDGSCGAIFMIYLRFLGR